MKLSLTPDPRRRDGAIPKVCTACHRASPVREWRWSEYQCPECTAYDADFARNDKAAEVFTLALVPMPVDEAAP